MIIEMQSNYAALNSSFITVNMFWLISKFPLFLNIIFALVVLINIIFVYLSDED
jgi:hypothetical protein